MNEWIQVQKLVWGWFAHLTKSSSLLVSHLFEPTRNKDQNSDWLFHFRACPVLHTGVDLPWSFCCWSHLIIPSGYLGGAHIVRQWGKPMPHPTPSPVLTHLTPPEDLVPPSINKSTLRTYCRLFLTETSEVQRVVKGTGLRLELSQGWSDDHMIRGHNTPY